MDLELTGKIALVTGASAPSIGRGIATVLAAEGAQIVVVARRGHLLATLQDEIEHAGGKRPFAITADLSDRSVFRRIRDQVLHQFGHLDILVNAAGGSHAMPTDEDEDVQDKAWDDAFALNFTPARKLVQAFLPGMQERKWGRIVNITGSLEPQGTRAAVAAKAGVMAWTKGMSREAAKHGITINCIVPGRIHTEQSSRIYPTQEIEAKEIVKAGIPVGYFGEPYDIGYTVTWLCSPKARYITGQRVHVDGGMHHAI